jgi:hypothetical protein
MKRSTVCSHPLGLSLCLGPDPAVDIKARVPPGEKAVRPFGTQELPGDEKPQDLAGEEFRQPRVVDPRDLIENSALIHSPHSSKRLAWQEGQKPQVRQENIRRYSAWSRDSGWGQTCSVGCLDRRGLEERGKKAGSYSCLIASTGLAVAALTDWKLTVNRATASAETEARRNGPAPRRIL